MTDDDREPEASEADFDDWFAYAQPEEAPPARSGTRSRVDLLAVVAALLAVVTIAGLFVLWPDDRQQDRYRDQLREVGIPTRSYAARVDAVDLAPCAFEPTQTCLAVGFELLQGPDQGEVFVQQFGVSANAPSFTTDTEVVLGVQPDAEFQFRYQYQDRQRRPILLVVLVLFAVVVVALGRWRGLAALGGLAASVGVLLVFVLPAILDGRSPVLVAVVGAAAIAYVALYSAHGVNRMTTVALLGMLAALALTALLSSLVLAAAQISGFATEETILLSIFEGIDIRGLVLAGTVLGAAGALDDVAVTQASAVWELRATNPTLDGPALFRSGLRIGRDHIASTVNTLLLAYAGAALPLLVLFVLAEQSLGTIANSEVVAIEILRTLVGSIGLVAAVPFTTWLAARTAPRSGRRGTGHAH